GPSRLHAATLSAREGEMTTQAPAHEPMHVYLEVGKKRVFACALEWPGWCRSAKAEADALAALAAYAARYAVVAREAGLAFPGTQQTAFPGTQQTAFPGTQQTAFPGSQQAAFPGSQQTAVAGTQPTSFPGAQLTGFAVP